MAEFNPYQERVALDLGILMGINVQLLQLVKHLAWYPDDRHATLKKIQNLETDMKEVQEDISKMFDEWMKQ